MAVVVMRNRNKDGQSDVSDFIGVRTAAACCVHNEIFTKACRPKLSRSPDTLRVRDKARLHEIRRIRRSDAITRAWWRIAICGTMVESF